MRQLGNEQRIPEIGGKGRVNVAYDDRPQTAVEVNALRETWNECARKKIIPSTDCCEGYIEWREERTGGKARFRKPKGNLYSLYIQTKEEAEYGEQEKWVAEADNSRLQIKLREAKVTEGKLGELRKKHEEIAAQLRRALREKEEAEADAKYAKRKSADDLRERMEYFECFEKCSLELEACRRELEGFRKRNKALEIENSKLKGEKNMEIEAARDRIMREADERHEAALQEVVKGRDKAVASSKLHLRSVQDANKEAEGWKAKYEKERELFHDNQVVAELVRIMQELKKNAQRRSQLETGMVLEELSSLPLAIAKNNEIRTIQEVNPWVETHVLRLAMELRTMIKGNEAMVARSSDELFELWIQIEASIAKLSKDAKRST